MVFRLALTVVALVGVFQLKNLSFMVDNIPLDSQPKKDLAFFEKNFKGVMPLEIVVDTKKKRSVTRLSTLKLVEKFEKKMQEVDALSAPLSVVTLMKASTQAFYNNKPEFYSLPGNRDRVFIFDYLQGGEDSTNRSLVNTLVDSTGQKIRISYKVADLGSIELNNLINNVIRPIADSTFQPAKMEARITGNTLIFLKGNDYLVSSIKNSLVLAIILIGFLMALLFGSFRMIIISIITNILPLLITGGIMGYFGIPLKPSTGLIFSIAFGIAVDDSIHYLARYRQALLGNQHSMPKAIEVALRETGSGMIYTSIILFFGFIVFATSDFDGTKALGYLTAITLFCAMFGNLILLPRLLLTFGSRRYKKHQMQLIEFYDERGIYEEDDEEIDLSKIRVKRNGENHANGHSKTEEFEREE